MHRNHKPYLFRIGHPEWVNTKHRIGCEERERQRKRPQRWTRLEPLGDARCGPDEFDNSQMRKLFQRSPQQPDCRLDGLAEGQAITLATEASDGIPREKRDLKVYSYDIPQGCIGAYYPECNVLIPLSHHAEESKVPAGKSVPVRIKRENFA